MPSHSQARTPAPFLVSVLFTGPCRPDGDESDRIFNGDRGGQDVQNALDAFDTPAEVREIDLAELVDALTQAAKLVATARHRFPKSIRNADTFQLNLTAAALGRALSTLPALP